MICSISGETCEVPVVSKKSGHIFEKRLVLKYIEENSKCPVTGEDLAEEDLVEVSMVPPIVKPRVPTLTSIPSLLSTFQNEWDSLMLETYQLKEQNIELKKELSHSLYQNDAAYRVIARLKKERDQAREALAGINQTLGLEEDAAVPEKTDASMDVDDAELAGITEDVQNQLDLTGKELSTQRKKRRTSRKLNSSDKLKHYEQTKVIPSLHSSTQPGITCMDLYQPNHLILTGGNDKEINVIDYSESQILFTAKGHTKKVLDVLFYSPVENSPIPSFFSASSDNTIKYWSLENDQVKCLHTWNTHHADVVEISVHPSLKFLSSVSLDSTWAFHDLESMKTLQLVKCPEVTSGYSCGQFHPDGLLLGTGTVDGQIRIWDVKSQANLATFTGHEGPITSMNFSENGKTLATVARDNVVKIWDLRKQDNITSLPIEQETPVNVVQFDHSGSYLAAAGLDVKIFHTKQWNEVATFSENNAEIVDVRFGDLASFVVSTGLDRAIRIYSKPE